MTTHKIKNKVIEGMTSYEFETKMDDFLEGLDSYSIQYKPVSYLDAGVRLITYTALVTYSVPLVNLEGEEDDSAE